MSARAGGSAAKLPLFREFWPMIDRGLWRPVNGTPLNFHIVEASWIRGRLDPTSGRFIQIWQDFCLGGNFAVYPWMEKNLAIVESCLIESEREATAVHEFEELITVLKRKKPYEPAHTNFANPREKFVREHPDQFEKVWASLCYEYRVFVGA